MSTRLFRSLNMSMATVVLTASLAFWPAAAMAQHGADSHAADAHAADGHSHEGADAHGADAHADDAHGDHHAAPTFDSLLSNVGFWGSVVNFILLLSVLHLLLKKPLLHFLTNRRNAVEEGLVEAQKMKAEAEAKHKEYSERLEKLDAELEDIRADMRRAGEAERDRIVAEAEKKASRLRKDAQFVIDQQLKQLRIDLTREAVDAAIATAEKVLTESTNAADQTRLAQEYLKQLAEQKEVSA